MSAEDSPAEKTWDVEMYRWWAKQVRDRAALQLDPWDRCAYEASAAKAEALAAAFEAGLAADRNATRSPAEDDLYACVPPGVRESLLAEGRKSAFVAAVDRIRSISTSGEALGALIYVANEIEGMT